MFMHDFRTKKKLVCNKTFIKTRDESVDKVLFFRTSFPSKELHSVAKEHD